MQSLPDEKQLLWKKCGWGDTIRGFWRRMTKLDTARTYMPMAGLEETLVPVNGGAHSNSRGHYSSSWHSRKAEKAHGFNYI